MSRIAIKEIFKGLCWVEVAEADLRLCCGCPPDTVKHLKKHGLLWGGEGHAHGPNALLISDSLVSGGRVTSFSEFPIMQMLYMQGMLHQPSPQNELPLLIGLRENVGRQMEYLLRGNYGCLSREELLESGSDEALAEQLYAVKLWFSDDKVLDKSHLCSPLYLGNEEEEIKKGVTVKRIGFDRFQITYKNEKVVVDLTSDDKVRPLPYVLHNHRFQWVDFGILHTGEGNGWETGNPCMSSIIINNGKAYTVDAGPGFQENIGYLGFDVQDLEGIFLTHVHDDHFSGLSDLFQCIHKMKFFATPQVRFTAQKKFAALLSISEEKFAEFFEVIDLAPNKWNEYDGLGIFPFFSPHPVETNAFNFRKETPSGIKTYSHLADTISFENLEKLGRKGRGIYSDQELATLRENYTRYADVKKVDVGGGLIHGVKNDYENDSSEKIVFSHNRKPLVSEGDIVKQEGCFGEEDILAPGDGNELMGAVFSQTLIRHFSSISYPDSRDLLAVGEWMTLKRGEAFRPEKDYCAAILNGNMRLGNVSFDRRIMTARGTILGLNVLFDESDDEFKANTSFVSLLKFPRQKLVEKLQNDHNWQECLNKQEQFRQINRLLLSKHILSSEVVIRLCAQSTEIKLIDPALLNADRLHDIYLLSKGKGWYLSSDNKKQEIRLGDFFGGNALFSSDYGNYEVKLEGGSELIRIPASALENIPFIWWMIYENCTTLNHLCKIV